MTNAVPTPQYEEQEEVFFSGRLPFKASLGRHGLLYFLLLGWNIGLLIAWLGTLSLKIKLTSQRVVLIRGLISQREEDVPLYRANDIGFEQTVAGRLLGTGVISVHSDDQTSPHVSFPFVRPQEHKEKIRESMIKERRRFRTVNFD